MIGNGLQFCLLATMMGQRNQCTVLCHTPWLASVTSVCSLDGQDLEQSPWTLGLWPEGPVRVLFPWAGQAKGLVPALELFSEPHWRAWPELASSLLRSVPTANTSGPRASPSGLPGAVLLWHQMCLVGSLHLGLRPRLAVDLLGSEPGRSCIPAGLRKDST